MYASEGRKKEWRTRSPAIADILENFDDDPAPEHQRVVCAFDDIDLALIGAHRVLHPPYRVLSDLLVLVAVPHPDCMRIRVVREAPRLAVVVEDL